MRQNDRISRLNLSELNMILDMFEKNDKSIVSNDKNFMVRSPQNCYDTNYSIYDKNNDITYLVDINDIDSIVDYSISELISLSWKTL